MRLIKQVAPIGRKAIIIVLLLYNVSLNAQNQIAEKPNILWVVSEDNSKHFVGLYEKGAAAMPTIEKLAKKGLVFNHAFSQAPVCSVARSTIITGCYAPRVGAQYHRRTEFAPLPDGLEMFPYYLRKAGYYTSNNSKEDYNFKKSNEVWDESSRKASYKNRKSGQPFFHVQNFGITHEGRLHFTKEKMTANSTSVNPNSMKPFPYHPDTETTRFTYAWYHELHKKVDEAIGEFIAGLESEGLMENTIVFYYGDHGGVLPRSKGYIYESGLHVPLVVYFPPKWQHLAPASPGSRIDGFVGFIDLAPTVLNLAGVDIPEQIDGKPFLGSGVSLEALNNQNTSFAYADRFDEKYDLVRSLRKGNHKYIRSYQPFNIDGLFNFYRYKMLMYREWKELYHAGKLNAAQQQFFQPRPAEALYDLSKDPHEINDLSKDPAYATVLKELREELQTQVKSMPDLSFFPEPYFLENGIENPVRFGQEHKTAISRLIDIADLSLGSFADARAGIKKALKSKNPWERYWGLIACSSFNQQAASFYRKAGKIMKKDKENLVKVRAAEFLALAKKEKVQPYLMASLKQAETATEANLIMNTLALLKELDPDYQFEIDAGIFDPEWLKSENTLVSRRLQFLTDDLNFN